MVEKQGRQKQKITYQCLRNITLFSWIEHSNQIILDQLKVLFLDKSSCNMLSQVNKVRD